MSPSEPQPTDRRETPDAPRAAVRMVRCPTCGGPSRYANDNPNRPFCSPRCQGLDLGAWAAERYALTASAPEPD